MFRPHRPLPRLIAALLLLCALPAWSKPALWVARDADTTVYLFGTVHLLPHAADWRDPQLARALDDSGTLYLEIADDDPVRMQGLILKYGLSLGHPLSQRLDAAERTRLAQAAAAAGLPGTAALEAMQPWLAGLTLAVAPLLKAGMDPADGVDKQIRRQFEAAGKPVEGLETSEQQIRFFADMPDALQMAFLRSVLEDFGQGKARLDALVEAWKDGDVAAIARTEDRDLRQQDPRLYRRLLVDRNRNWAGQLAALMKQRAGTFFVAVGAAHLAGPDSVQTQLRKLGIRSERE